MKVRMLNGHIGGEETLVTAARGDYLYQYVGDMDYDDVIKNVRPRKEDYELAREMFSDDLRSFVEVFDIEDAEKYINKEIERHACTIRMIRRLMRDGHWGPFEHPSFTASVGGVSRALMAQITRHRLASFDVQSFRYTVPDRGEVCRIGLDGDYSGMEKYVVVPRPITDDEVRNNYYKSQHAKFMEYFDWYDYFMENGLPKKLAAQDARSVLPQYTKCNMTISMNLRSFLHIMDMRGAANAQWEIRELTEMLEKEVASYFPITMRIWDDEFKNRKNRLAP